MALLPVLVTAALLVFAHIGGVLVERKSMLICQAELAEGQRQAGDVIEKILALNRPIFWAKKAKAIGEALMTNPYTLVQGERIRSGAILTLRLLLAKRQMHIIMGTQQLWSAMSRAESALRDEWRQQHQQQSTALMAVHGSVTRRSFPYLAIRPSDPSEEYPEYELMPLFSSLQAQSISWKTSYGITKENRSWSRASWSKPQSCEVTLQERTDPKDRLQVRLNTGKFSLRRWF
ncbi:MAG: hypothetical protein KF681_06395 [Bdellovibrionaceae bacterium]|nr:hypothetical protein [Pseudobdellovibrionaceae bacterium]